MMHLQPYCRLEITLVKELIAQQNFYLVSQSYVRAQKEVETKKIPVLFSAYAQFDEAFEHYKALDRKGDTRATLVDISKKDSLAGITELCDGKKDETAFFARIKDPEYVDQSIQNFYQQRLHIWLTKEKEKWDVNSFHIPQFSLETLLGEPVIKIQYGEHFAIVSLDELERL
jgi:hypothetical protein